MRKHASWYMWASFVANFLVRWVGSFTVLALLRAQPRYVIALIHGVSDFARGKFDESRRVNDERADPTTPIAAR